MKRILAATALALAGPAFAADPASLLAGYQAEARKADSAFAASTQRGAQFFSTKHGNEWSCASCHGSPPTGPGRHAKTGKAIRFGNRISPCDCFQGPKPLIWFVALGLKLRNQERDCRIAHADDALISRTHCRFGNRGHGAAFVPPLAH